MKEKEKKKVKKAVPVEVAEKGKKAVHAEKAVPEKVVVVDTEGGSVEEVSVVTVQDSDGEEEETEDEEETVDSARAKKQKEPVKKSVQVSPTRRTGVRSTAGQVEITVQSTQYPCYKNSVRNILY